MTRPQLAIRAAIRDYWLRCPRTAYEGVPSFMHRFIQATGIVVGETLVRNVVYEVEAGLRGEAQPAANPVYKAEVLAGRLDDDGEPAPAPKATTEIQSFTFPVTGHSVRVVKIDGEPWWVAKDVCDALGVDVSQTRRLDDDEKGLYLIHTPGGSQKVTVINESGLYALVLTSRKPEAKAFKKWVTSEVLPSIRKTGGYSAVPQKALDLSDPAVLLPLLQQYATEKKELSEQLAVAAPKAEILDQFNDTGDSIGFRMMAKDLGANETRLREFLLKPRTANGHGFWYRLHDTYVPYQEYGPTGQGLFWLRTVLDLGNKERKQIMITPKGQLLIRRLWNETNGPGPGSLTFSR